MKCKLEIIGEFSEFSNTCQECSHYQSCMNKCYAEDKRPVGDNFPTNNAYSHKIFRKNRQEFIEKLLLEKLGKITQDDIDDLTIDIGLYNENCKKKESIK